MASRWMRLLRHRLIDERDARRLLGEGALGRIAGRVATSERRHSGEIRVCVEGGLPLSYLWRNAAARERAIALFGKLRVWDTEANNGVLIYLLLADHQIEIVADRGIDRLVDDSEWLAIAKAMSDSFHAGSFEQGILRAIEAVEALLVRHFPLAEGARDTNELPDEPAVY